ncbi:MAG: DUF59 domain-containing protein [Melioribacteraceae bacterium]|nr:DUF59 domain-containing protein [Melioribacteraceae bacterium]
MIDKKFIEKEIIRVLKTCYDPEIPVDIYELGLIYEINVNDDSIAEIKMTLTSPACPVAESLPNEVKEKVEKLDQLDKVNIELVWEPQWNQQMMTEAARLELGLF